MAAEQEEKAPDDDACSSREVNGPFAVAGQKGGALGRARPRRPGGNSRRATTGTSSSYTEPNVGAARRARGESKATVTNRNGVEETNFWRPLETGVAAGGEEPAAGASIRKNLARPGSCANHAATLVVARFARNYAPSNLQHSVVCKEPSLTPALHLRLNPQTRIFGENRCFAHRLLGDLSFPDRPSREPPHGTNTTCQPRTPDAAQQDFCEHPRRSRLVPPGYHNAANRTRRYPVFYFTDGVAAFHGRRLDVIARELIRTGKIPPTIFVGIDNGGSTRESKNPGSDRANEYLPFPDDTLEPPVPTPHGKLFPAFFETEVRPLVESRYRTSGAIGLAGASYGGAIAVYTAMENPGRYKWLLIESPSLYIARDILLRRAEGFRLWPQRVYVGAGTSEGRGDAKQEMVDDASRFARSVSASSEQYATEPSGDDNTNEPSSPLTGIATAARPARKSRREAQWHRWFRPSRRLFAVRDTRAARRIERLTGVQELVSSIPARRELAAVPPRDQRFECRRVLLPDRLRARGQFLATLEDRGIRSGRSNGNVDSADRGRGIDHATAAETEMLEAIDDTRRT